MRPSLQPAAPVTRESLRLAFAERVAEVTAGLQARWIAGRAAPDLLRSLRALAASARGLGFDDLFRAAEELERDLELTLAGAPVGDVVTWRFARLQLAADAAQQR